MRSKECIAMILAGGQGSRLGILTKKLAKPAVSFGGKYRIIDFVLSNCSNSNIDTVGVLTQYQPLVLNSYIGIGDPWNLNRKDGGVTILPPYVREKGAEWYKGTANAIYQNIHFINQYNPKYVLILSGDHIYKMDYAKMLDFHKENNADATISVIEIPWEEACRFGIMNTAENNKIKSFEEKPKIPKNNLASMGVYIFSWEILKKYLIEDEQDPTSNNDFGKNIIPKMLNDRLEMYAYPFKGYWKDVGTIESLWEANMDLLSDPSALDLHDPEWPIYSVNSTQPPNYLAATAKVRRSLINGGCQIFGEVENSVLFPGVYIGAGSQIKNSIIMPNVKIQSNVKIESAIIAENTIISEGCQIGYTEIQSKYNSEHKHPYITVVGENILIPKNSKISKKAVVSVEDFQQHELTTCNVS
ncbi:MAG: glucose-phosphate adenylyltransferase [Clostridiales bacterium]|jgi:glucose-1-phosphate adenylyltransferase|nr:glucose-phosphate adenylyltransferase [Clostridiales bacterium]MDK2933499.1 glucose-phosphate adenylyltransferase [Clostridiales bacterium]